MSTGEFSDHALVNFGEDYELDYILKKFGKAQSAANRRILRELGALCKELNGKTVLTHAMFYQFLKDRLYRLGSGSDLGPK